jgi:hypothetical protein
MAEQSDYTTAATQETAESAALPPEGGPAGWESPAEADRRAHGEEDAHPEIAVLGAFVGAFVAAKLLGRLGGGND